MCTDTQGSQVHTMLQLELVLHYLPLVVSFIFLSSLLSYINIVK